MMVRLVFPWLINGLARIMVSMINEREQYLNKFCFIQCFKSGDSNIVAMRQILIVTTSLKPLMMSQSVLQKMAGSSFDTWQ